jgi:hypothetical protein
MALRDPAKPPASGPARRDYRTLVRQGFLLLAALGLVAQVVYDGHLITVVSLFPQWLLLASLWWLWRPQRPNNKASDGHQSRATILAVLIPTLACFSLLVAWLGWKAHLSAACGVVPFSDARMYYASAQTLLREGVLDIAGQRRPLNVVVSALWLYLSGDHFKILLLLQTLAFSAAAFLASWLVAMLHGFRAGLLLFAFLLVFAEPYLPTTMSETSALTFGALSLVACLAGVLRRKLTLYWLGVLFLALALVIRPSAILVLASVVIAGAKIFGDASRSRRGLVVAVLSVAVLIPSGASVVLNKVLSHHDGAFNANAAFTVYGLVVGGKGWEQYQKDHPQALVGLPEAGQAAVVLQAAKQHFLQRPWDLVLGLAKGQVLGPVKSLNQATRQAFLGADGDPLRLVSPAISILIFMAFVAVICVQLMSRGAAATNSDVRLFALWFLLGYLLSIPFFYEDGGVRLHAAVLPFLAYLFVWLMLLPSPVTEYVLTTANAHRLAVVSMVLSCALGGTLGCMLVLTRGGNFAPLPRFGSATGNTMIFLFKPGWPQCDLRKFEKTTGEHRPLWFSGVIPDYNDRAQALREIAGRGNLYLGVDAGAREWKAIHTDADLGLLTEMQTESAGDSRQREAKYGDYDEASVVRIVDTKAPR